MTDPKEFPSDKADKFVVRFPDGMRDRIAEAAKANNRSMNAEIVARLQSSVNYDLLYRSEADPQNTIPADEAKALIQRGFEQEVTLKKVADALYERAIYKAGLR